GAAVHRDGRKEAGARRRGRPHPPVAPRVRPGSPVDPEGLREGRSTREAPELAVDRGPGAGAVEPAHLRGPVGSHPWPGDRRGPRRARVWVRQVRERLEAADRGPQEAARDGEERREEGTGGEEAVDQSSEVRLLCGILPERCG